ncbi:hypothetical protein LTS18_004084, partial [Coniosporium uncinatum]
MAYNQGNPQLGATFVPGGFDDYYLPAPPPDVISPFPQRITPEVPQQIQDGIAHLELDATETQKPLPMPPNQFNQQQPQSYQLNDGSWSAASNYSQPSPQWPDQGSAHQANAQSGAGTQSNDYTQMARGPEFPNFSPFPKLANPPRNVPPSDTEKEAILENARLPVLNSNNPETQLAWAQDALEYVHAAAIQEQKFADIQTSRPATPNIERQLRTEAMNIVNFLADQLHPKAQFMRGMWHEFGKFGLPIDKREAFMCYVRASEKGYSRAEYRMGMQFEQSGDPVKALVHYKRGAEAGDSASNYRLGMMTLLGQAGQPQDYPRGIALLRQAASNVDENAPQGAYVLGMLQARQLPQVQVPEIFLPHDEEAAKVLLEKAAFLGFAKAQLKMGQAYELCELGCEFNPALSLHYNALAARQGEPEAELAISKWFLCGYQGVFEKNEQLAYQYAHRAAHAGLPTAQFAMGYYNEIGMSTPVDLQKALEWYEKAADNGNKDALGRIEGIRKSKTLSKKDHENVAIARIKSQYGSRRGSRPERFTKPIPPLPIVTDEPEHHGRSSSASVPTPQLTPGAYGSRLPSRNSSTTPYPLDDKPSVINEPMHRPATAAPYPMGDGPFPVNPGPGPTGGFFRPHSAAPASTQRPSSAFKINPAIFATAGQTGRMPVPQGQRPLPNRPSTSTGDMGFGRQQQPPSNFRTNSGPPGPGYGQNNGTPPQRPETGPPPPSEKPQPNRLDIGYSAPVGPGRGSNQTQGKRVGSSSQQGPPVDIGYVAPLNVKPKPQTPAPVQGPVQTSGKLVSSGLPTNPAGRVASGQVPQGRQSPRPGSAGGRPAATPPRKETIPKMSGALPPASNSLPADKPADKPAVKPAPAPSRPPGKG